MIPGRILADLESLHHIRLTYTSTLSGGSINQAAVAESGEGLRVLKWNRAELYPMFETEQKGLDLLRGASSGLLVPLVQATGRNDSFSWILMDYIPQGAGGRKSDEALGNGLAALHRTTKPAYGLDHDNYIGRLPQHNSPCDNWITFFMARRIEPQLRLAVTNGLMPSSCLQLLPALEAAAEQLFPQEPASLLHGDLWGGNFLYATDHRAALIDPAVYYGHREMELAFTGLFGGFSQIFYDAYENVWPLEKGFNQRKDLYNLYPVLVHVNLFGQSYTGQANQIIKRFTS